MYAHKHSVTRTRTHMSLSWNNIDNLSRRGLTAKNANAAAHRTKLPKLYTEKRLHSHATNFVILLSRKLENYVGLCWLISWSEQSYPLRLTWRSRFLWFRVANNAQHTTSSGLGSSSAATWLIVGYAEFDEVKCWALWLRMMADLWLRCHQSLKSRFISTAASAECSKFSGKTLLYSFGDALWRDVSPIPGESEDRSP